MRALESKTYTKQQTRYGGNLVVYRAMWFLTSSFIVLSSCSTGELSEPDSYDLEVVPTAGDHLAKEELVSGQSIAINTRSGSVVGVNSSSSINDIFFSRKTEDVRIDLFRAESDGRLELFLAPENQRSWSEHDGWTTSYNTASYASVNLSEGESTRSNALNSSMTIRQQTLDPLTIISLAVLAYAVYETVTATIDFVVFHEEHVQYTDTGYELCATPKELVEQTLNALDIVDGVADKGLFLGLDIKNRGGTFKQTRRAVLDISQTRGPISRENRTRIMWDLFEKVFKKAFDQEARSDFYEDIYTWYARGYWTGVDAVTPGTPPNFMLYNYSWLKRVYEEQHFKIQHGYLAMYLPIAKLIFPDGLVNNKFMYFDIDWSSTCGGGQPVSPVGAPCVLEDGYYTDMSVVRPKTPASLEGVTGVTCVAGLIVQSARGDECDVLGSFKRETLTDSGPCDPFSDSDCINFCEDYRTCADLTVCGRFARDLGVCARMESDIVSKYGLGSKSEFSCGLIAADARSAAGKSNDTRGASTPDIPMDGW